MVELVDERVGGLVDGRVSERTNEFDCERASGRSGWLVGERGWRARTSR